MYKLSKLVGGGWGNLDKIQKNSSFSSGDLPFIVCTIDAIAIDSIDHSIDQMIFFPGGRLRGSQASSMELPDRSKVQEKLKKYPRRNRL